MTSDNGPQLSLEEFWKFTETWSIETKPRVQDIHRRMVMSEKVIQTAKQLWLRLWTAEAIHILYYWSIG
jgi:hypothetical protein